MILVTDRERFNLPLRHKWDSFMLGLLNLRITSPTSRIFITGGLLSLLHHWHVCDSETEIPSKFFGIFTLQREAKKGCSNVSCARPSEQSGYLPKAIDWSEANLQPLQLRLFESERQNQICNLLAQTLHAGLKIEEESWPARLGSSDCLLTRPARSFHSETITD